MDRKTTDMWPNEYKISPFKIGENPKQKCWHCGNPANGIAFKKFLGKNEGRPVCCYHPMCPSQWKHEDCGCTICGLDKKEMFIVVNNRNNRCDYWCIDCLKENSIYKCLIDTHIYPKTRAIDIHAFADMRIQDEITQ